MGQCDGCGCTHSLSQGCTCRHHARGTHRSMRDADVAPGEEEVANVAGIERPIGQAERGWRRMENRGFPLPAHAPRMVVVHGPSTKRHQVFEVTPAADVMLGDYDVPLVAPAFSFAGQEAHPIENPVVCTMVTTILDVVPYPERDLEQLVADGLCVVDGVLLTAKLDPPEITRGQLVIPEGQIIVSFVDVGPSRRDEWLRPGGFTGLDQTAHAHRLAIRLLWLDILSKLSAALTAEPIGGP